MKKPIFLLAISLLFNSLHLAKQNAPEPILYNGKIFTNDQAQSTQSILIIVGGKILHDAKILK